ncbi:hypothetical protein BTE48_03970 [Oceanospirillum multiglobuliferum]|uniref:Transport permease protein n=1 Tax=Oceanospirillum multiglobuliferum TaxID=64969 RepID=A0A1V4T7M9_9GAMM|nr:hypothetical protein BTE48_03970 [Oceanospirillum multiglobuliferum]
MQERPVLAYFWPKQHFGLLYQLVQRDIRQRYKGSWLGMGWSLITPLIMLSVYTFVFQFVFKARWPGAETGQGLEFALNLFAGLIFFTLFSDVMTRASSTITQQPNLVKKVVFPLHLLSWVVVLSALFQAVISLGILALGTLILRGEISVQFIYISLIILVFLPLLLGMAWGLAALGVYLPDTQHLTAMATAPLMFLSPVFYPVSMLPDWAQGWINLNPLTLIIEATRASALGTSWPSLENMLFYVLAALIVGVLGASGFQKLRKGFADVL